MMIIYKFGLKIILNEFVYKQQNFLLQAFLLYYIVGKTYPSRWELN